jgi:two-component system, CAI-1 autoinducer sensor kinase/phosphatase CqsS
MTRVSGQAQRGRFALFTPFRRLFEQFKAYHSHGRAIVQYTGIAGIFAFPMFYLLRFMKATPPAYDDVWLRAGATLICVGLALKNQWPDRLKPYYLPYAYAALVYCMPFFFIFTSLTSGGGSVAVANTLVAVFFLILLSDWRNTVVMLIVGGGAAVLLYAAVVPDPEWPKDYIARLPIGVLVVVGGSLFKFAEKQAEAEKVKRTYTELAASIAHEMRNPLSQIRQNLEKMQQALPPPSSAIQAHALAPREVDALYRHLAESELAVARGLQVIAMTLDEVSEKPVDTSGFSYLSAAAATHKAVQEYSYQTDDERAKVSVQVVQDFSFHGDETAYLFVLFNLLKNALYYLELKPEARIVITVAQPQVLVRDTGPGVAAEVLARLFEPFTSVGKSGGTGLGLAYCHRVMRAFGGEIACASAPGEYTEFALSFPPIAEQQREAYRAAVLDAARATFSGKRLLIVDDDAAQRATTRHKLEPVGAVIDQAAGGQRALEALASHSYDLVLLDLNMPVVDGYAVAERIRNGELPLNRHVRLVAYTSEPAHLATVKTQKAGMNGFVSKPCAQLPLIQHLQQALERPAVSAPAGAMLAGRRVLLADDSSHGRKAVAAYLKHAGAMVTEAAHGAAVLDHLHGPNRWDAILMDINMPGMNGLDAARAIRASAQFWRDTPILALTAYSDQGTVTAARASGMNDFLVKPVDAGVLYEKLRRLTSGVAVAPAVQPIAAPRPAGGALLNEERLESYRRMGMLHELLVDYLPEIARLARELDRSVVAQDFQRSLDLLHSLLGTSGEAGAQALHQLVRETYVPMVEGHSWPASEGWLDQITALAADSERALSRYGAKYAVANAG